MWLYYRFVLSYRDVEELLAERGIAVSYETIRRWCQKVGQTFADGLRRRRPRPGDKWHIDEVLKKAYDEPRLKEPVPWFNNQVVGPMLKEAAEAMLPFYQGVWWPEISSAATPHIRAALQGQAPPGQALEQAQNDVKAAIEAAGGRVEPDGTIR